MLVLIILSNFKLFLTYYTKYKIKWIINHTCTVKKINFWIKNTIIIKKIKQAYNNILTLHFYLYSFIYTWYNRFRAV